MHKRIVFLWVEGTNFMWLFILDEFKAVDLLLEPFESYGLEVKIYLSKKYLIYIEIRTFVFIKMPKYSIWMAISELSLDGLNFYTTFLLCCTNPKVCV